MRLRMLCMLLLLPITLATGALSARAQAPGEAEHYVVAVKARHGENSPEYAEAINNLAELFRVTNRLGEAEPLMCRALAIDENAYGPNHSEVAINLSNLALLLKATNRLAEAEPLMHRALAIDEKAYGPDHPNVATTLNNLAALFQPPFDAGMAHALYHDLFGGIEDLIKGKSLLIAPSGPLTQLPFEALVTAEPDKALPRFKAYRSAAWLGQGPPRRQT